MRTLITIILLSMALPLLSSFLLQEAVFDLQEALVYSQAELLAASGLRLGQSLELDDIRIATGNLQSFFLSRGHYYVEIAAPELIPLDAGAIRLEYRIRQLQSVYPLLVSFSGSRYFTPAKLREFLFINEDTSFSLEQIPALLQRVVSLYNSRGYLYAAAELDSLYSRAPELGMQAIIRIEEGPLFRLSAILTQGNVHSRASSLIRISGLNQYSTITPALLEAAEQRLLSKSYIEASEIVPLDASRLLIRVKEGKMTYLEGLAGLSRQGGKSRLSGLMRLRFQNLWGTDRAIRLYWRSLPQISQSLELSYHESGIDRFPIAADLSLSRVAQDSTWIKSRVHTDLYYFNQAHQLGLELIFDEISPGPRRPILIERNSSRSLGAWWTFLKQDHPSNPGRGTAASLRYRYYISPGDNDPKTAVELSMDQYLSLSRRLIAALGLRLNSLDRAVDNSYYYYKMGGYNSLRGYREESYQSWRLGWYSLELRYRLDASSRFYGFFDQGALQRNGNDLQADLFSLGLGMKYRTRLGILSIEYALGYREGDMWNLGRGIVHLGIDSSF